MAVFGFARALTSSTGLRHFGRMVRARLSAQCPSRMGLGPNTRLTGEQFADGAIPRGSDWQRMPNRYSQHATRYRGGKGAVTAYFFRNASNSFTRFGHVTGSKPWITASPRLSHPQPETIEIEVDDRCSVEGQQLTDEQSPDDRKAER